VTIIGPKCCCGGDPGCASPNSNQYALDQLGISTLTRSGNAQSILNMEDYEPRRLTCSGFPTPFAYYDYFGPADQSVDLTTTNTTLAEVTVGRTEENGWLYEFNGPGGPYSCQGLAFQDYYTIHPAVRIASSLEITCETTLQGDTFRRWTHRMSVQIIYLGRGSASAPNFAALGTNGQFVHDTSEFGSAWISGAPNNQIHFISDATTRMAWTFGQAFLNNPPAFNTGKSCVAVSLSVRRGPFFLEEQDYLLDVLPIAPTVANSSYPDAFGLLVGQSQLS